MVRTIGATQSARKIMPSRVLVKVAMGVVSIALMYYWITAIALPVILHR